jgi:hypothetical protein
MSRNGIKVTMLIPNGSKKDEPFHVPAKLFKPDLSLIGVDDQYFELVSEEKVFGIRMITVSGDSEKSVANNFKQRALALVPV